jgi:hypothetical protein
VIRPLADLRDLVRMLAAQAPRLAAELLPNGRRDGHEWRDAPATAGAGEAA